MITSQTGGITVKTNSSCESYVALSITMPIAMEEKVVNKSAILNHFNILLLPSVNHAKRYLYSSANEQKDTHGLSVSICKKAANVNCFCHNRGKISYYP